MCYMLMDQGPHQVGDDTRGCAGDASIAKPLASGQTLDHTGRVVDSTIPAT